MSIRLLLSLFLVTVPALPQLLTVGVKGGVPFTDAFKTARSGSLQYLSNAKRYTVGPTVELGLPMGFRIELDALYKRINYTSVTSGTTGVSSSLTTANTWEFPLQLKHRLVPGPVAPYIAAGVSFRDVSSVHQVTNFFTAEPGQTSTDRPVELDRRFTAGFVVSGGIAFGTRAFRVSPEVRYTRWGWDNFQAPSQLFRSNPDQAEFLLGITF